MSDITCISLGLDDKCQSCRFNEKDARVSGIDATCWIVGWSNEIEKRSIDRIKEKFMSLHEINQHSLKYFILAIRLYHPQHLPTIGKLAILI